MLQTSQNIAILFKYLRDSQVKLKVFLVVTLKLFQKNQKLLCRKKGTGENEIDKNIRCNAF